MNASCFSTLSTVAETAVSHIMLIKNSNNQWNCEGCDKVLYNKLKPPCKKVKCGNCRKNIPGQLHAQGLQKK